MQEFLFVYRMDASGNPQATAEQRQAIMKSWQEWLGGIAAQNQLTSAGSRLQPEGKVVKSNSMVTDGPYIEMKEAIGGYSIVKAASLTDAATIAKGCPILFAGGNVEVRELVGMEL